VLIVGSGDIGTRHLQSICTLQNIEQIEIVDPNPKGLALGKQRLSEIKNVNPNINFHWLQSLDHAEPAGDLCIIATQADIRPKIYIEVAERLGYKKFILEKIVAQSINDYLDILECSRTQNTSTWVNCKTRAYPFHINAKSRINGNPFILTVLGGNHGLGTNGVHWADLFSFYSETSKIESAGSTIDNHIHPSKRGESIHDLSGTLHAKSNNGSQLYVSYIYDNPLYEHLTIISPTYRYVVDHIQGWGFESSSEDGWKWHPADLSYNILISSMTRDIVSSIFTSGTCNLPSISDCFLAHKFILDELLPHFQSILNSDSALCPIT
tara:strand:+ start:9316 stop:10287 length:972 start_codon:yes stop_codon:yes gene_type:complete